MRRSFAGGQFAEAFAERLGALRARKEAFEERAEIKSGAADDDGECGEGGDIGKRGASEAGVFTSSKVMVWRGDVEQMMGRGESLIAVGLGGADLEVAIDGDGVAADD